MFLLYIVAYLDRINVGFAALQMNAELQLSNAVFGFGSGIFFIGYFLFEIPSNLILHGFRMMRKTGCVSGWLRNIGKKQVRRNRGFLRPSEAVAFGFCA